MGKYSLEDIERMTTKKSRVSDRTSENGRRQTNIPALESRELVRKQEVSNATKKVSDTILGDEQGNNWLTKILNPGGAIDKLGESIEAAGKSALYNIPGAKTFAKAIDKYVDPLLGTNLVDSEAMEAEVNELAKEHKVASALGNVGGNMAMSVVGGQALNAIPMVGKLSGQAANTLANTVTGGKLSQAAVDAGAKHLKNVLGDAVFDVTADTLPQMVNAAMDGKGAEVGKIGVENTLQNLAFNAGGEMAGMAIDSLKGIRNKNRIPQLGDLSEETEQAAKSSTDIPNVDVQSPEQVSEAVNEIPALKNVDEMAGGAKKITDPAEKAMLAPDVAQTHTAEEIATMQEYLSSEDEGIISFAEKARKSGKGEYVKPFELSIVSERQAEDIKNLTGIDATGNKLVLDKSAIEHIDKRHGTNGAADNSMADDLTLSRMQYVLDKYDDVGLGESTDKVRTKSHEKAPTVVFEKKIDGNYYVVEAVTDAKSRTNRIVSVYTSNKKVVDDISTTNGAYPMANADIKSPSPTSYNGSELTPKTVFPMANADIKSPSPTSYNGSGASVDSNIPALQENVNYSYITDIVDSPEDFANATQKAGKIPKTQIPSSSKFSKMDKDMTKLVKWYGDETTVKDLEDFRSAIVDFENTGSREALDRMDETAFKIDQVLQGKKYSYPDRFNKNGSLKRKGATYTYGDAGSVGDIFDETIGAIEETSKKSSNGMNEIPYLKGAEETSEDIWEQLQKGNPYGSVQTNTVDVSQSIPSVAENGEYVGKTATNTLAKSELVRNNPQVQTILEEEIKNGNMNFRTIHEDESIKAAKDAFEKDAAAETDRLMSTNWTAAKDFDGGMMLLKSAADSGDYDSVRSVMRKIVNEGHDAGVSLQALSKYSRTAEGALAKAQMVLNKQVEGWKKNAPAEAKVASELTEKLVKAEKKDATEEEVRLVVEKILSESKVGRKIGDDGVKRIVRLMQGGYADSIESTVEALMATQQYGIKDETIQAVGDIFEDAAKYGADSKKRVELENKAFALLANEVTTSDWKDKWDTWRYLSMLSKPATHIRNSVGNVGMNVVSSVKNSLAATMEATLQKVNPNINRTKSVLTVSKADKELIKAAAQDADNVAYRSLSGSKYGAVAGIEGQSKAFREGAGKVIQKLSDFNSDLLEKEDWIGLKAKYSTSLAGYLKANKLDSSIFSATDDASKNYLEMAREYAIREAQRATFHEASTLADALSSFSRTMRESDSGVDKAISALIEGIVPFKKTPINIVKTAGRYSPLGIVDAVKKTVQHLHSGKYTAAEVIDSLSSGLTGSGIMALGVFLGSQGLIRGAGTGDEAQDSLDTLRGAQDYSIQIGNKNYTIDWAAPSVLPLLVGVELQNALSDGGIDSSEIINAVTSLANPVVETTMMSGLSNALSAAQYAEDSTERLTLAATNALTGYVTQGMPTTLGAVARAVDNTRRTSYAQNTSVAGQLERSALSAKNKIPFLSKSSAEYRDAWGRTQENFKGAGDNLAANLAYQIFSPGYYSEFNSTPVDDYVQKLYDKTDYEGVVPQNIKRSFRSNGETVRLSGKDYSTAQEIAGTMSYDFADYMRGNAGDLSASTQAEILERLYDLSKNVAYERVADKPLSDSDAKCYEIYQNQGTEALVQYLALKENADLDNNQSISQDEAKRFLDNTNLSNVQKAYLWKKINSSWKSNPY